MFLSMIPSGFLPTYGPTWVNMYGSTRDYRIIGKQGHLNDGLGEGVSYRGRVLLSLKTEIIDSEDLGATMVEVEATPPISEVSGYHFPREQDSYIHFA